MSQEGQVLLHRNLRTDPKLFLRTIDPFREDLVVGVECMFTWYWLADLCTQEQIHFVLGHALYMKAIHGGKAVLASLAVAERNLRHCDAIDYDRFGRHRLIRTQYGP